MVNEFEDLKWMNLPPEEVEKIIRDYEDFKKRQVENPVTKFVKEAVEEFQALLKSTSYEFAVKNTRKYLWRFQELIKEELVIRKDELIADFILKVSESQTLEEHGVEFLMYTELFHGDSLLSLMLVRINHTVPADVTVDFGKGLIIKKREVITLGTYAVLIKKNVHTGRVEKRVYYLPT